MFWFEINEETVKNYYISWFIMLALKMRLLGTNGL